MLVTLRWLIMLCLVCVCSSLAAGPMRPAVRGAAMRGARQPAATMMARKKLQTLAEQGFWEGEWLCADCGYIYEPDPAAPFEKLPNFWKCPQCAGPRRRFVKKAGDMLGDLDDSPLVIGTAIAAFIVAALVYLGLTL